MEDEEESGDRLSNLPEALLTSILSMIPTKQAVSTSVLSKRWKYLWQSITHLQLLDENLFPTSDDDDRSAVELWHSMLNSIELCIRGPIYSCRISFNPSYYYYDTYILRLHAFLLSLIEKGIKELSIVNRGVGCYELPSQVFLCPTLEKLELGKCVLSTINQSGNIKSLTLFRVYITNDQFENMISCCVLLESLKVDCCVRLRHLKICAPKLVLLEITTLKKIRISLKDAPYLRRASFRFQFEFENTYLRYCDDSSREEDDDQDKKLIQLLKDLSHCPLQMLSLNFCIVFAECFQRQRAEIPTSLPPRYQLQVVKKLNIELSLGSLQMAAIVSCLFQSCPNLEELFIQDKEHLDTTGNYWENQNPSCCLINSLKIVQICGVNLHRSYWMGLVGYLSKNAHVCERITIQYKLHNGDQWSKKLEKKLKMLTWANGQALLELKPLSST